jgi:amidohydrolase
MGSCAHFKVTLTGKGGHSSRPHLAQNPVAAAAAIVVQLEGLTERLVDSRQPAVLVVCRVTGGNQANVIADTAVIEGTARSLSPAVDKLIEHGFRETVESIAASRHVSARIDYQLSYPVTENTPEPTDLARRVIKAAQLPYRELPESSLEAEDFSYFLRRYPGVYVKIGTGEDSPALHNSQFDFPDEALQNGITYLVNFALEALK